MRCDVRVGARLAVLGIGAWMALAATPVASQAQPDPELASIEAEWAEPQSAEPNRARLDRIYAEHDLDLYTERAGWAAYLGYLLERLDDWIAVRVTGFLNRLLGSSTAWRNAIYGVIGAALVALLVWLALLLRSMLRQREPEQAPEVEVRAPSPAAGGADAAAWRAELDRRLAAGDLEAALEAAWWWLACSLAGSRVNPAWTSRELLVAAGRPDLGPAVRGLDAMIYGGQRLERTAVERVVDRLAQEVAA